MTSTVLDRAVLMPRPLYLRPSIFGLALLSLFACTTTSTGVVSRFPSGGDSTPSGTEHTHAAAVPSLPGTATLPDAEAAYSRGNPLDAAARYQSAASSATNPTLAAEYRLRAAELANAGNDPARADLILDLIPAAPLDARQQTRYRLLRAQTALARNDAARALRLLPVGDPGGEPALASSQLLVRARALTRIGDPLAATQALVQREGYLSGAAALAENREAIWTMLSSATLDSATIGRAQSTAPVVRGWVELAALARRSAPLQDYEIWRKRFPGHPGEERLAALYVAARADATPATAASSPALATGGNAVTQIPIAGSSGSFSPIGAGSGGSALLLPESGPLLAVGDAVRSGYAAAASKAGASEAHAYDTTASVSAAYQHAITEGAGLIVGPLRKEDAAALAQAGTPSVPVLALNYLDNGRTAPAGFYQFGLAPEDEARAAAEDAYARGLQRALAMVPNTEWGNRVLAAFEARLRELGGHLAESGHYAGDPQNWSDPVRRLLRYAPIEDKRKAAEARAKVGPGIDPQRRNDFDFVFIAGRASQARVLGPLFRYYHADRVPLYATSAVFEGDGDSDLSGIRFCDSPWLLDDGGPWASVASDARSGRNLDNARLFAMGHDAWLLASRIAQNQLHPGDQVPGATGLLRVDNAGAIHRGLTCVRMTSGVPSALEPLDLGAPPATP